MAGVLERHRHLPLSQLFEQSGEVEAGHIFERQEVFPLGQAVIVGLHHVRMGEPQADRHLLLEELDELRVGRGGGGDLLDHEKALLGE
jgi:hypothetical protein